MIWYIGHPSWKDMAKTSRKRSWKGIAGWKGMSFNMITKQSPVLFCPIWTAPQGLHVVAVCTFPPPNRSRLSPSLSCDPAASCPCRALVEQFFPVLGIFASASPTRRGNGILFLLDPPTFLSIFWEK